MTKTSKDNGLKKAPEAPRRFKSAYMFFSIEKHKELRLLFDPKTPTPIIAKMVSNAWKSLSEKEKEPWHQLAARDRARFEIEKKSYNGRWKAPKNEKPPKDPNAPRRPITAFLAFSNHYRETVKSQYPGMRTTAISKILAQMWKDAPKEERMFYLEQDRLKRHYYKAALASYKTQKAIDRSHIETETLKKIDLSRQEESLLQEVVSYQSEEVDKTVYIDDEDDCWEPLPLGSSRADIDAIQTCLEVFTPDGYRPWNPKEKELGIIYRPCDAFPTIDTMTHGKENISVTETPSLFGLMYKTEYIHAISDQSEINERLSWQPGKDKGFHAEDDTVVRKHEVAFVPDKMSSNPDVEV